MRTALVWLCAMPVLGQGLQGVIDIHVHAHPDVVDRSLDAIEAARMAKERGLRGIVLKNHYEPTASLAFIVRKLVPGIEVFGGIALNSAVGGVNPAAVERMAGLKGGWGRIVWMPTFDAGKVAISRNGRLLPETLAVLDSIAKHNLVLATGHSTPEEVFLLLGEARSRGITRLLATHPMTGPHPLTTEQMKEVGRQGAFIEVVSNAAVGPHATTTLRALAEAIRAVGPDICVLASDLGQAANPLPVDGLETTFRGLREAGISAAEIERMSRTNPARLLGLP